MPTLGASIASVTPLEGRSNDKQVIMDVCRLFERVKTPQDFGGGFSPQPRQGCQDSGAWSMAWRPILRFSCHLIVSVIYSVHCTEAPSLAACSPSGSICRKIGQHLREGVAIPDLGRRNPQSCEDKHDLELDDHHADRRRRAQ
jgi:hypothetical protein